MKSNLKCTRELRVETCTDSKDYPRSVDSMRICLGCPILKMTIEEKSIDDIAIALNMNPHTAATFRNHILWKLGMDEDRHIRGYAAKKYMNQDGKLKLPSF